MRKIISNTVNTLSVVIIVAAIFILLTVVMTKPGEAPNIMGYSVFRVLSGSMQPAIPIDSLVFVKHADADKIREGDIISFYSRDPSLDGFVNTHRVVSIEKEQGAISFTTKGDSNYMDDRYPVSSADLIGKVVHISPILGKFVRLLSNPLIFLPLIVLPLLVILLSNLIRTIKVTRTIAKEEEEAAIRQALEEIKNRKKEDSQNS